MKRFLAMLLAIIMISALISAMIVPVTAALAYEQIFTVADAKQNSVAMGRNEGGSAVGAPPAERNYIIWWDNGGSNQANGSSRYIEFTVSNVPADGKYALDFYWWTRGDGPGSINTRKMSINATSNSDRQNNAILLKFNPTKSGVWEYFTYIATLRAGTNTIRLWFDNTSPTNTWLIMDHMRVRGPGELFTVKTTAGKGGAVSGSGEYMEGESVALSARPFNYHTFIGWYENDMLVSTNAEYTFTAADNRTLEAKFIADSIPDAFAGRTLSAAEQAMLDYLSVFLRDRGVISSSGQYANGTANNFGSVQQYGLSAWSDMSAGAVGTGDNGEVGFWHSANAYEALNTAYEMTDDPAQKELYKEIMDGYRVRMLSSGFSWPSGGNWRNNEFTDDLLWWSNAFTNSYMLTGDIEFLNAGRMIYDRCWVRAWDNSPSSAWNTKTFTNRESADGSTANQLTPGGLTWKFNTSANASSAQNLTNVGATNGWGYEKNNATNWNGALNAARLALVYTENPELEKEFLEYISQSANQTKYAGDFHVVTGSDGNWLITDKKTGEIFTTLAAMYTKQAELIWEWSWENLVIEKTGPNSGRLTDNYNIVEGRRDWQFTYNYGLAAHASVELWNLTGNTKYLDGADIILEQAWERQFTRYDGLTMRDEGGMDGGDGAAFRLPLVRAMGRIINDDVLLAADSRFEDYKKYMLANAHQAWTYRRANDGMIGSDLIAVVSDDVKIHGCIAAFLPQILWYSGYDPNADYSEYFDVNSLAWMPTWGQEYQGGKIYLAQAAKRDNINFGHSDANLGAPASGSLGTHAVFWNPGGNNNNADGTTRFLEWEVEVDKDGLYQLGFRWYTRENNLRTISINGGAASDLWFISSEYAANPVPRDKWGWEFSNFFAELKEGKNVIKVWYNQSDPRISHDRNYPADTADIWGDSSVGTWGVQGWLLLDYLKVSSAFIDTESAEDLTNALENENIKDITIVSDIEIQDIEITDGKTITVNENATLEMSGNVVMKENATLEVSGNVIMSENTTLEMNGNIVMGENATLEMNGNVIMGENATFEVSGNVIMGENATLEMNGKVVMSENATLEMNGNVIMGENATLEANGNVKVNESVIFEIHGTIDNDGTIHNYGTLNINANGSVNNNSPHTIINYDTINVHGTLSNAFGVIQNHGAINVYDTLDNTLGVIKNLGGTINVSGVIDNRGEGSIINNGTITFSGSGAINGNRVFISATPSATVSKLKGNQNQLIITVTETYSDGSKEFVKDFIIDNNAEGTYTIGDDCVEYVVFVDTKGNDQIRDIYIVSVRELTPTPSDDTVYND